MIFFPYCRLVKSESSESLLSQTSGNSNHHHHHVTARKPQTERSLPVTCPLVPVPSCETPKLAIKTSSGQKSVHESKTSRQIKESRSQKHTRVKIYFPFFLVLHGKSFWIWLKHMSKKIYEWNETMSRIHWCKKVDRKIGGDINETRLATD